ncbi:MAG: hypothetical protein EHM63_02970, partial [Actinobacteria bacterium]
MAIKRIESFDHWVTADAPKKGWTFNNASVVINAGTGRNGTAALRNNVAVSSSSFAVLGASNGGRIGVIGFALRVPTLSGDTQVVHVMEGGVYHLSLGYLSTGALRVYRGNALAVLGTSVATPIAASTYYFVEFAFTIHGTTGTYDVRVNGVSVVSGSGANTQVAGTGIWNGFRWWGGQFGGGVNEIDDLYIADDLTFRGDHRIVCLLPSTGNGTHAAWTPSTGTDHGALVDDASPNITDYVSTQGAGYVD